MKKKKQFGKIIKMECWYLEWSYGMYPLLMYWYLRSETKPKRWCNSIGRPCLRNAPVLSLACLLVRRPWRWDKSDRCRFGHSPEMPLLIACIAQLWPPLTVARTRWRTPQSSPPPRALTGTMLPLLLAKQECATSYCLCGTSGLSEPLESLRDAGEGNIDCSPPYNWSFRDTECYPLRRGSKACRLSLYVLTFRTASSTVIGGLSMSFRRAHGSWKPIANRRIGCSWSTCPGTLALRVRCATSITRCPHCSKLSSYPCIMALNSTWNSA